MEITGGCLCKAVRYHISAEPIVTRACWCRVCQYIGAGSGTVNVCFPSEAVSVSAAIKAAHVAFMEPSFSAARIAFLARAKIPKNPAAEPPQPADHLSPDERRLVTIAQKIGYSEVLTMLENIRFLGYDVAMTRLSADAASGSANGI